MILTTESDFLWCLSAPKRNTRGLFARTLGADRTFKRTFVSGVVRVCSVCCGFPNIVRVSSLCRIWGIVSSGHGKMAPCGMASVPRLWSAGEAPECYYTPRGVRLPRPLQWQSVRCFLPLPSIERRCKKCLAYCSADEQFSVGRGGGGVPWCGGTEGPSGRGRPGLCPLPMPLRKPPFTWFVHGPMRIMGGEGRGRQSYGGQEVAPSARQGRDVGTIRGRCQTRREQSAAEGGDNTSHRTSLHRSLRGRG